MNTSPYTSRRIGPIMVGLSLISSLLIVGLSASAQTGAAATSQTTAEQRASICTVYDQMNQAFVSNHIDTLMDALAPGYTQTDPNGHVLDKQGTLKKLQGERSQIKTMTTQYSITNVKMDGNTLVVDVRMHSAGTGQKKVLFMRLNGTFTNDMIVQDFWVNTPAGWRMQSRRLFKDESHTAAA